MPSDAELNALADILHHIELAQAFSEDFDYESFHVDTLRVYAVTRCLEIISEASRRLSDALKARHPHIAWKEMAGAGMSIVTTTKMSRRAASGRQFKSRCLRCAR